MKRSVVALLTLTLVAAAPAMAGGSYGYHGGGYHNGGGYHHKHYKHSSNKYGYLAAGLILGGVFTSILTRPRYVYAPPLRQYYSAAGYYPPPAVIYSRPAYVERTVIVQQPPTTVYVGPSTTIVRPAPSTEGTYFLKRANGGCFLVENQPNGDQILRPQPPEACT